jgi:hypothetical protein
MVEAAGIEPASQLEPLTDVYVHSSGFNCRPPVALEPATLGSALYYLVGLPQGEGSHDQSTVFVARRPRTIPRETAA